MRKKAHAQSREGEHALDHWRFSWCQGATFSTLLASHVIAITSPSLFITASCRAVRRVCSISQQYGKLCRSSLQRLRSSSCIPRYLPCLSRR